MYPCFFALGKEEEGRRALLAAIGEAPGVREPWMELAEFCYAKQNWHGVIFLINEALKIKERPGTYMTQPEAWNEHPFDLLSLAYYCTGDGENALRSADKALEAAPDNERIKNNRELFIKY